MWTLLRKEFHHLMVILIPFIYLASIYHSLPPKVPIHWNVRGEIDRFGNKPELALVAIFPLLIYLIFTLAPKVDPKYKIKTTSGKFQRLKTLLTVFTSLLSVYILYSVKNQTFFSISLILLSLGLFYTILGNYFKTIKANYFIGIRTPWTLENEEVWKSTHVLGGKLWFIGGMMIVILSLAVVPPYNFYLFLMITAIITLLPMVYSYIQFKKLGQDIES